MLMSSERLMVVEDEVLVAADMRRVLRQEGFRNVIATYSSTEALVIHKHSQLDLVVMDIRLGSGADGIETALEMKQTKGTPVLFVSAYSDDPLLERAKIAEPLGYLLKPFPERELVAAVRTALKTARKMRELARTAYYHNILAESTSTGFVFLDARGMILHASDQAHALLGNDLGSLEGRDIMNLLRAKRWCDKSALLTDLESCGGGNIEIKISRAVEIRSGLNHARPDDSPPPSFVCELRSLKPKR